MIVHIFWHRQKRAEEIKHQKNINLGHCNRFFWSSFFKYFPDFFIVFLIFWFFNFCFLGFLIFPFQFSWFSDFYISVFLVFCCFSRFLGEDGFLLALKDGFLKTFSNIYKNWKPETDKKRKGHNVPKKEQTKKRKKRTRCSPKKSEKRKKWTSSAQKQKHRKTPKKGHYVPKKQKYRKTQKTDTMWQKNREKRKNGHQVPKNKNTEKRQKKETMCPKKQKYRKRKKRTLCAQKKRRKTQKKDIIRYNLESFKILLLFYNEKACIPLTYNSNYLASYTSFCFHNISVIILKLNNFWNFLSFGSGLSILQEGMMNGRKQQHRKLLGETTNIYRIWLSMKMKTRKNHQIGSWKPVNFNFNKI